MPAAPGLAGGAAAGSGLTTGTPGDLCRGASMKPALQAVTRGRERRRLDQDTSGEDEREAAHPAGERLPAPPQASGQAVSPRKGSFEDERREALARLEAWMADHPESTAP